MIDIDSRELINDSPIRPRRLRRTTGIRQLVRENAISASSLIHPFFVVEGTGISKTIEPMPGQFQLSVDMLEPEIKELWHRGIRAVLLFGIPDEKDSEGTAGWDMDGPVSTAIARIKEVCPEMVVIADVCLCEYTDHGHCGIVDQETGIVDNDATLPLLGQAAVAYANAGADIVAPSAMMDGQVMVIRAALDDAGHTEVPVMAYSAKYASAFYGPFRVAAESTPQFGDRRTYQMDSPNAREALREVELDILEGADIVMVKPAGAYLDIIRQVRDVVDVPVAAYQVSGEYAMLKAAAMNGWLDEKRSVMESLMAIKRSGADMIITYYAKEVAGWLREDENR